MTIAILRSTLLMIGVAALALAAVQDLRNRTIPNRLVITVNAAGLLLGAIDRPFSLWINIVVALAVLVALSAVAHLDTLGSGDVKLMAAATFLVPPSQIAGLLVTIALAGGLLSVVYIALRRGLGRPARHETAQRSRNAWGRWWRAERARIRGSRTVPYALAISGGSISFIIIEWYRCLSATSCSL